MPNQGDDRLGKTERCHGANNRQPAYVSSGRNCDTEPRCVEGLREIQNSGAPGRHGQGGHGNIELSYRNSINQPLHVRHLGEPVMQVQFVRDATPRDRR